MSHVKIAVFPVAGLGTRFLPATKAVPKEMLPLVDRPLIDYAIEEARAAGIEEFVFVSAPGKGAIAAHYDRNPELERNLVRADKPSALAALARTRLPEGALSVVHQHAPRGLGQAIGLARRLVGGRPFAVLLPDDVIRASRGCLSQMIAAHAETGGHMVAAMEVAAPAVSAYGILDVAEARAGDERSGLVRVRGLVEKPAPQEAPSRLAIVGRYILDPAIFAALDATAPDKRGEIQITDAINAGCDRLPVSGFRFEGERFDCGSVAGFVEATVAYALDRPDLAAALAPRLRERVDAGIRRAA